MIVKKRITVMLGVFGIIFLLLIGRLFYIQILGHEEFSKKAFLQQHVRVGGINLRGTIYDMNKQYAEPQDKEYIYIVPKICLEEENIDINSFRVVMMRLGAKLINDDSDGNYYIFTADNYFENIATDICKRYGVYCIENNKGYYGYNKEAEIETYREKEKMSNKVMEAYIPSNQLGQREIYILADAKGKLIRGSRIIIE